MSGPESKLDVQCGLPTDGYDEEGYHIWLEAFCYVGNAPEDKSSTINQALRDAETPGLITSYELTASPGMPQWSINSPEFCDLRQNPPFMKLARMFTDSLTDWCVPLPVLGDCYRHEQAVHHEAEKFFEYVNPLLLSNLTGRQINGLQGMAREIQTDGYDDFVKTYGSQMIAGIDAYLQKQGVNPVATACPITTDVTYFPKAPRLRIPTFLHDAVEYWSAVYAASQRLAVYALRDSKKGLDRSLPGENKLNKLHELNAGRRGERYTYSSGKYEEISGSAQMFSIWQPQLEGIFEKAGLPGWMSVLPIIESRMIASAGAVGASAGHRAVGHYQFLPDVGSDFGLKIEPENDERMNPIFAAIAAADKMAREKAMILNENFVPGLEIDDTWANLLTVAAFHTGIGNLRAALRAAFQSLRANGKSATIEEVAKKLYTTAFKAAGFGDDSKDYLPQLFVAIDMVYRRLIPELRLGSDLLSIVKITHVNRPIPWDELVIESVMESNVLNDQFGTLDFKGEQHTENTSLGDGSRFLIPSNAGEQVKEWLVRNDYARAENLQIEPVPMSTEGRIIPNLAP